jgi:hypothetical protein
MLCYVMLCCVVLENAAASVCSNGSFRAVCHVVAFLKIQQTFAWQNSFKFPPLRGWCRMTPRGVLPGI